MRLAGACFLAAWGASLVAAQTGGTGLPPDLLLLARIKLRMQQNLSHLPNYTCLQTIERSRRRPPARRFEYTDTVRLEVALVGGKEMFAWPGAKNFEDRDITEIVQGGAIGTGDFALHARAIFLGFAPIFRYVGEETLDQRRAVRYDYSVPLNKSDFSIQVPPQKAVVGYHGSFWADAETLDLIRLEIHADAIPPELGITSAIDNLYYERRRIGDTRFLLPARSDLVMVDENGNQSQNRTGYSDCRQYAGESTLTFGDAPATSEAPRAPVREFRLPPGLTLQLELDTEIDSENAAAGDPIHAVLIHPVRQKKTVLVPKGAVFAGRILRVEHRGTGIEAAWLVVLRFDQAEFDNTRARLAAELDDFAVVGFWAPSGTPSRRAFAMLPPERPGTGLLLVHAPRFKLRRGMLMFWHTIEVPEQENP